MPISDAALRDSKRNAERYRNDPEFRERRLAQANAYRLKKKAEAERQGIMHIAFEEEQDQPTTKECKICSTSFDPPKNYPDKQTCGDLECVKAYNDNYIKPAGESDHAWYDGGQPRLWNSTGGLQVVSYKGGGRFNRQ